MRASLLALALGWGPPPVAAQFNPGPDLTTLLAAANSDLNATVITQADPALIQRYWPALYQLPAAAYTYAPPDPSLYTMNVIFDPCRGYGFNCCSDTYGTPEYQGPTPDPLSTTGEPKYFWASGAPLPVAAQRTPRNQLIIDDTCLGLLTPRPDCVMRRVARAAWPRMPACWNWNASVVADAGCLAPADGAPLPLCLALGYTQTAYVVQCGGQYAGAPNCGTVLEVHRPGRAPVLSAARLVGVATSGYRMTVVSTTYMQDPNKVLCYDPVSEGRYEVWWVLRTLYGAQVQLRSPFAVVSPVCDWDAVNNRYLPYASLAQGASRATQKLTGLDPFHPSTRVYTQPRPQSRNGYTTGPGMGATFVPPDPGAVPAGAVSVDNVTYTWRPSYALFNDTAEGGLGGLTNEGYVTFSAVAGEQSPSRAEQEALREAYEERGYRRAQAAP